MKYKVLYLTNQNNDGQDEEEFLTNYLSRSFALTIVNPLEALGLLSKSEMVLIRNIWPTHEYLAEWNEIKQRLRNADIPIYNPLGFKGDIEGKQYLAQLYSAGYHVIPSIDTSQKIGNIAASEYYFCKPFFSCDGIGAEKISADKLRSRSLEGLIIQPFLTFDAEISFFFVDNVFSHAVSCLHRLHSPEMREYECTSSDIRFASPFVLWSGMPYGVQRIDAIRLRDGTLLLTEIENLCPYLFLLDVKPAIRFRFLKTLENSISKSLYTNSLVFNS